MSKEKPPALPMPMIPVKKEENTKSMKNGPKMNYTKRPGEVEIEGQSKIDKDELIKALRNH